ncbi:MAG TPA: PIN domain-containing protein [Candidatus Ruania gallistercoris]|uniref:Ribonuclease VapC n=1 Tax=Candidatus Ruania gallistercoris TaxID=2838746 RepID=A0A9D2EEU4_9MICO|nr:PIN domain-containing protein [Candidatus Ruania gallistercoris]
MLLPDVNVLVAAHRPSHPHHESASVFLNEAINGTEAVVLPDLVATGFVRIVTNSRIFSTPSSIDEAFGFLRAMESAPAWSAMPRAAVDLHTFESACKESGATGALVTDAYLAAIAIAFGIRIASFDRDFRKFDQLAVVELAAE